MRRAIATITVIKFSENFLYTDIFTIVLFSQGFNIIYSETLRSVVEVSIPAIIAIPTPSSVSIRLSVPQRSLTVRCLHLELRGLYTVV